METTQIHTTKFEIYYHTKVHHHMFGNGELEKSVFVDEEFSEKRLAENGLSTFVKVAEHIGASHEDELERIFAKFNDGTNEGNPLATKEGQDFIRANGVSHTSMSVQDLVVFNNEIYVVKNMGFKNIGSVDQFN